MFRKLKSKIVGLIKSKKLNVFLLFLSISIVVLLLSKLGKTQTKTFEFGLKINNLPQEYICLNKDSIKLNLTLKAQGYKLLKYYLMLPKIDIDFDNQTKKNDSIYYWDRNNGFSSVNSQFNAGEEIVALSPDSLFFEYDINSVKKLPIVLQTNIRYSDGYDLSEAYSIEPDSVKIVGPKSMLSSIKNVYTDTLRLNDVKKNIKNTILIRLPEELKEFNPSNFKVTVNGKVEKFTEGVVQVPISVINVPTDIEIKTFPKEVSVYFYTSLSAYNRVTSEDFKVECDYSNVSNNQPYLIPELVEKPNYVKTAKVNLNRVEFIQDK